MNPRVESNNEVHQAIVEGNTAFISDYLSGGGSANITDSYDCEPIYTVVKYDQMEIAIMMLEAGGDINRQSKFRGTPFGAACWNWNLRMIDFCISAGVEINAVNRNETILDSLLNQRSHTAESALASWQATFDKLLELGAKHIDELGSDKQTGQTTTQ